MLLVALGPASFLFLPRPSSDGVPPLFSSSGVVLRPRLAAAEDGAPARTSAAAELPRIPPRYRANAQDRAEKVPPIVFDAIFPSV